MFVCHRSLNLNSEIGNLQSAIWRSRSCRCIHDDDASRQPRWHDFIQLANRQTPSGQFWHEQNIGLERNQYDVYISPNDQRSKEIARQVDAIGDFLFVAPSVRQLELHSLSVAQTYMFVFDYKGTKSFGHIQLNPYGRALSIDGEAQTNGWLPSTPTSTGAIISTETSNYGVTHCDDLFYLLPNDFAPLHNYRGDQVPSASGVAAPYPNGMSSSSSSSSLSSSEMANDDNAIRNYVTYLAAYASRINEQQSSNNLANWLPFRTTDRNYLRFSEQIPTLYKNFHQIDVAFVNELVEPIEELVNTPLPLFPYEELRDFKVSTAALGVMLSIILISLLIVLLLIACRRRSRNRKSRHAPLATMLASEPAALSHSAVSFHQQQQQRSSPSPQQVAVAQQTTSSINTTTSNAPATGRNSPIQLDGIGAGRLSRLSQRPFVEG